MKTRCETCRFLVEGNPNLCGNQRRNSKFQALTFSNECKFYEDAYGSGPWEDCWLGGAILLAILIILGLTILIPIGLLCN